MRGLQATSKGKTGTFQPVNRRTAALSCFSEGAKAARAQPMVPKKTSTPVPTAKALRRREEAILALSPTPADPTQAPNRKAKVLIKTGPSCRIENIEGPWETLRKLAEQLTIIAEALTTARARPEQPPPRIQPQTKPTAVKERLLLSPLMQSWINGSNKTKVDLKGVNVGGKRILVALPADRVRKRKEKRYKFRTGFASLADLQASQYKSAFELFLPIVQGSEGELGQLVEAMERKQPGSGLHHLAELLKAQSPLTCIAHARAYLRFQSWASEHPPLSDSKIDRLATMVEYVNYLTVTLQKRRTVPRAMLMHVGWIDTFLGVEQPWPVHSPQLAKRVAAHHKQASRGKPTNGFLYSPLQVKIMAASIETLTEPLHRTMLRLELFKIFGLLRTDDARWIHPASVQLEHGGRALIGMCTKSKGSERTAGRLLNGMPFRIPLIASLNDTGWWKGYLSDLHLLGIDPNDDHSVPLHWAAVKHGVKPGVATVTACMSHLRTALRACGLAAAADRVAAHSAKRSGMAIINRYTGPAELTDGQKSDLLHHRATGKRKCAGAYDPHLLVGPVKKARLIWDEWLTADRTSPTGPLPPPDKYLYAKIRSEKEGFEGTYRHHVMVQVNRGSQTPIRQLLKHKSKKQPMRIFQLNQEWEALCDRVPAETNRIPLKWSNGQPLKCKECLSRAGRYMPGFRTSRPLSIPVPTKV